MITIETRAHVGADGTLAVQVPTALREEDVEVLLVLQSVASGRGAIVEQESAQDDHGYPPGFFEDTFGSLSDEPLERLPQGEFEEREPLAPYDMQIAAIAPANNLTMVTHNTGEFRRVPGLALDDWE